MGGRGRPRPGAPDARGCRGDLWRRRRGRGHSPRRAGARRRVPAALCRRPRSGDDRQPVLPRRPGKGAAAHRPRRRAKQRRGAAPIRLWRGGNRRLAGGRGCSVSEESISLTERLIALLDHLGIGCAHVASNIPGDLAGMAAAHPDRLGGIVLCAPVRLDPEPFVGVAERILTVSGEYGPTFDVTARASSRLVGAQRFLLDNYEAFGWSDVAADCAGELGERVIGFLGGGPPPTPPPPPPGSGQASPLT